MIISRTPFRISFFGGGTDYPVWYQEHGGAVLSTTIDKYCYLTCRYLPPFFTHKSRIVYSQVETVVSNSQIEHPAARGILQYLQIEEGVEIHHDGDLPARTGLGSSSSFTVGLLHALYGLKGVMPSKSQLAREAIYVEQELLKEHVGCQDQIIAAFGGLSRIDFHPALSRKGGVHSDGTFHVTPIIVDEEKLVLLERHLLLFFTGFSRNASDIAAEQVKVSRQRVAQLSRMRAMVDEAISLLQGRDALVAFGELLHESWLMKRSLTDRITTPLIDQMYERARRAGAIGGKLLGAGGGGFLLLFARPEEHAKVKASLNGLLHVPFRFEQSGSRIIFYEPQQPPAGAAQPKKAKPMRAVAGRT